jgi:transmembrane sensor
VTLRRGEAHFAVAKNPARPFVVVAGEAEVRAVGTAFAVGVATDGIDVVVTEGRVTVRANEIPVAPVLEAGGRVQLGGVAPARLSTLSPDEVRARLAWRVPRLHFAATPLARAVEMFNDHAAATGGPRLALAEPALGAVQVSGVLRADDHESLLRLLAGEFGIKAEPRGDEIVLRRQP